MSARHLLIAASVIATGFASGLAFAQPAPQPAPPNAPHVQGPATPDQARPAPGRFIEGRIAFLRTELKLTAQQQPLFDRLADDMRVEAKTMQEQHALRQQANARPVSALDRLEQRSAMMKQVAAAQDRYLTVFRPFYQSLSDEQKKTADQLFADHDRTAHGPMMGGKAGPRQH